MDTIDLLVVTLITNEHIIRCFMLPNEVPGIWYLIQFPYQEGVRRHPSSIWCGKSYSCDVTGDGPTRKRKRLQTAPSRSITLEVDPNRFWSP